MLLFVYAIFYCLVYFTNHVTSFERKLGIAKFNCTNSTGTHLGELAVIEAIGKNDKLFYLWDFGSKPTFLIVQVSLSTEVKLNCDKFLQYESDSIKFSSKPLFMFGVMLNKLYEFNDVNDTACLNSKDNTTVRTYNGEDFHWNVSLNESTKPIPVEAFTAVGKLNSSDSGSLRIAVGAYTGLGVSIDPPHILHTANGSQIDIILDNFQTAFNSSRFAVQLIIFSSLKNMTHISDVVKTVDDENTPGVFNLDTLSFTAEKSSKRNDESYLLWRPVVYTSLDKSVSITTGMKRYNMTDVNNKRKLFNFTLLNAIYGDDTMRLFTQAQNISFGSKNDKFYQKTRYSFWSFVIGTGDIPDPTVDSRFYLIAFCILIILSIFVMLIISGWIRLPSLGINNSRERLIDRETNEIS